MKGKKRGEGSGGTGVMSAWGAESAVEVREGVLDEDSIQEDISCVRGKGKEEDGLRSEIVPSDGIERG